MGNRSFRLLLPLNSFNNKDLQLFKFAPVYTRKLSSSSICSVALAIRCVSLHWTIPLDLNFQYVLQRKVVLSA